MDERQKSKSIFKTVTVLVFLLVAVAVIVGVLLQNVQELG